MAIPENLTHAEAGAFLAAVGIHMIDNDVCAEAVLDPSHTGQLSYVLLLYTTMDNVIDIGFDRAHHILTTLTPAEAIEFVRLPGGL